MEDSMGYRWNNNLSLRSNRYGASFENIRSQSLAGPYHWLWILDSIQLYSTKMALAGAPSEPAIFIGRQYSV